MGMSPPPQGGSFVFDRATTALTEQLQWIDALDTKAGVLIAADGVIAGLVLARGSILSESPRWVGVAVAASLLVSFVLALAAFATRSFETAPDVLSLVPQLPATEEQLKWAALPDVVFALSVNEPKVGQKAELLFFSGIFLLSGSVSFGGYFIFTVFRG